MSTKTTTHPHAKAKAPTRSGWRHHSIHRCPFCDGIARLGLERTSAPVPQRDVLAEQGAWYGSPTGWSEMVTPGGLVAISADHSHLDPARSWYANGRTCIYEVWTTERGAVPTIDQMVDEWMFPIRSYWDKSDGLRFPESILEFDLDRLIAGGWAVRAQDEKGGPPILLTLSRSAAVYRADHGKLPTSYAEAQGYAPKKDFELLRKAFLTEIRAQTKPRRS